MKGARFAKARAEAATHNALPRRKSAQCILWLALGWLLVLCYVGLLLYNAWPLLQGATQPPVSSVITRLLALPGLTSVSQGPATNLSPDLTRMTEWLVAALMSGLLLLLLPLTIRSLLGASPVTHSASSKAEGTILFSQALSTAPAPGSQPPSVASSLVTPAAALPPTTIAPRVFISHSSTDNDFGLRLAADLRQALGEEDDLVWYDSDGGLQGGDVWWERIVAEISTRPVFVVLLSPSAMRSEWVRDELLLAWRLKNSSPSKFIIPVLVEPCEAPAYLTEIQFVSFVKPRLYEDALAALLRAVRVGSKRVQQIERGPTAPIGLPFEEDTLLVPQHFVGRVEDLAWVLERLQAGGATALTAIRGLGGIGKTALAAVAIHQLRRAGAFPGGIAVVLCQGLTDPAEVLARTLTHFDPYRKAPTETTLADLTHRARYVLQGKKALVVLDNVEPGLPIEEVVAPLRAAGITLLLTARQTLPDKVVPKDANRILDLLAPDEALELFAWALGREHSDALSPVEYAAAERIVAALGQHTLAVRLAGAYAASTRRDLTALAGDLEHNPIEVPAEETPREVALILARSTASLSEGAHQLFIGLAAFTTPEFGRRAALALASGLGQTDPQANVDQLVQRALVEASVREALPEDADRERVRLHPLVRAFAESLIARWPNSARDAASEKVAEHYATYLKEVAGPYEVRYADEANVEGAIEWAHQHSKSQLVVKLCEAMGQYWEDLVHVQQGRRYLLWAVEEAEEIVNGSLDRRDKARLANLLLMYAGILTNAGDMEEALAPCERCLTLFREAQDLPGEGRALEYLGDIAWWQGQLERSEDYYHHALAIARQVGDRVRECMALRNLGDVALGRGQAALAGPLLEQALTIARQQGDRFAETNCLTGQGWGAFLLGDLVKAETLFQAALNIDRQIHFRMGEGVDVQYLGEVALRRGDVAEAERLCRQSLAIAQETLDRSSETQCLELLGRALLQRGAAVEATEYLQQAYELAHELDLLSEEARSLCTLAECAEFRGDLPSADAYYRRSIAAATECENGVVQAEALLSLGRLLVRRADREDGCRTIHQAERLYRALGLPGESSAREAASQLGCMDAH